MLVVMVWVWSWNKIMMDNHIHWHMQVGLYPSNEANYGVTELEELAIVWPLRHFRAYLLGHKCIMYTDHSPLKAVLADT